MGLILVCIGIIVLASIIGTWINDWDRGEGFATGAFVGFIIAFFVFFVGGFIGMFINTKTERITYDVPIVSLKDGSQIEGQISGGLFVMRGQIGEVQYFSYYRNNGNGSYSLDKKEADRSVIIPDATPETAKVTITDDITTCKETFWSPMCSEPKVSGIYIHGDFHVPANSIKNDFVLDAQ